MARSNDPDSASSQFFICHADSTYLDGSYAAFGKVFAGMDTVDKIIHIRECKSKGHLCLICCKNEGKFHFGMRRPKHGDSVISFRVCNSCLERMRNDIQETCE